ncbi:ORF6N domain-containing protein [Mixta mediterraneensis]|uniref:ORF6N domain-containing protein n=1 Tax=Mixta mediterraneensis TaxID=2758443 RepID=UPI0018742FF1|nr:ORF6N domain-containing protein [Mixta mediterraneensis]MBE5254155.1 ORF6N domain-containing protein [Mixta mediterraneensis]
MQNEITVESLAPLTHNQIPVITTELLANLYETEPVRIRQNYTRNENRFIAGKHYFLLESEELREFKHKVSQSYSVKIARNVRALILWTERGAARHAKMLETDQAWEVFERLEDCYFCERSDSVRGCGGTPSLLVAPDSVPHPTTLHFEASEPVLTVSGCAVSQLNALFGTVEYLEHTMWPHLRNLFPELDRSYASAFDTAHMLLSLLRDTRRACRKQTRVVKK